MKARTGSEWDKDLTEMKPELHERKWEIDSLCYPIRLAHGYWKTTGDTSCFDENWAKAMEMVVQTFRQQQRKEATALIILCGRPRYLPTPCRVVAMAIP